MAMLGPFVRVPEVLYTKVFRKESLSVGWERDIWRFTAVTAACAREARLAGLPPEQELRAHAATARACLRLWDRQLGIRPHRRALAKRARRLRRRILR